MSALSFGNTRTRPNQYSHTLCMFLKIFNKKIEKNCRRLITTNYTFKIASCCTKTRINMCILRRYFKCPTQLWQKFITKINLLHLVCLNYKYYGIIKIHGGSVFMSIHSPRIYTLAETKLHSFLLNLNTKVSTKLHPNE